MVNHEKAGATPPKTPPPEPDAQGAGRTSARQKGKGRRPLAKLLALIALSLTLTLTLSSCNSLIRSALDYAGQYMEDGTSAQNSYPDYSSRPTGEDWRTVPYGEMEYTRPDADAIADDLRKMTEQMKSASSFDEVMALDGEATVLMENFYTMRNLAEVRKYVDTNDSYYDEEFRYCDEAAVELGNASSDFNEAIVEGSFAGDYRAEVGDYVFESIKNDLMLSSDEVKEYQKERSRLNADYNQKLSSLTVSHGGREYTMEDIDAVSEPTLWRELYLAYYRENAPWFAETYAQMINLDKTSAATLGFDSAVDMYYQQYSRDYTPTEAKEFFRLSKEIFAPLVPGVMSAKSYGIYMDYDQTFAGIPALLGDIDPELAEVWNGMIDYGLYDYEAKPGKQSGIGFTTQLYAYDASFCYGYWDNDVRSAFTAIHEFGHYYDNWLHMEQDVVQNLDVAEIYSQGLEMLSFAHLGRLTDDPQQAARDNLSDMFQALTFQPVLEEFQMRLYEMDSFTAEDAGRLYTELLKEYGYSEFIVADENGIDNSWLRYTHLFDAPFYTISYATSGCAALQFWSMAQEDQDAAENAYMDMINSNQNRPFQQILDGAGLRNPFDETLLYDIAEMYRSSFDL